MSSRLSVGNDVPQKHRAHRAHVGAAPQAAKDFTASGIRGLGSRSYRRMSMSPFVVGAGHARDVAKINRKDARICCP